MRKPRKKDKTNKAENNQMHILLGNNTCISCGRDIPEGRMVCIACELGLPIDRVDICDKTTEPATEDN